MARDNELSFIVSIQDQASKQVRALEQTIGRLNKTVVTNIQVKATADDRPFRHMQKQAQNMEKQWAKTSAALNKKPPDDLSKWSKKTTDNLKKVGATAANVGKTMGIGFGISVTAAFAGMTIALIKYGRESIKVNAQLETFQTALRTTIGSLAGAKKEMAEIIEFARVTPYEIAGVTDAFVKLRAYALDPKKWATAAGDMAAAFGKPMIKAVEAIADATRGEFKRMREFGFVFHVNDFKKGGQHAGKTYADAIFDAISGRFKGGMALQAQTYAGIVSNLKDTMTIAIAQAGKPIFDYVKRSASALLAYFDTLKESGALDNFVAKFKRAFQSAQEAIQGVVAYIKSNWMPAIKSTIKNGSELASSLLSAFGPTLVRTILNLITLLITFVDMITKAANAGKEIIKVYVGFRIISSIFKMIGIEAMGATRAVVTFGAASTEAATASAAAAKRMGLVLAALVAMAAFAKSGELNNSVDEVIKNLEGMAGINSDKVKKNVEAIGEATGHSMNNVAKGMAVASTYGADYLEITAEAAKNARAFGMSIEGSARTLGDLGKAFSVAGGDYDKLSAHIYDLIKAGNEFGFDSDQLLDTLREFPEILHGAAGGYEEMIAMAKEAGKAHIDLGKILSAGELMRTPSKEMLIGGENSAGEQYAGINPTAWVTRSINDTQDFSKVWDASFEKNADAVKRVNSQAEALRETLLSIMTDPTLMGAGIAKAMLRGTDDFTKTIEAIRALDVEEKRLLAEQKLLQESAADQTAALGKLQEADWQANHATQELALAQLKLKNAVNATNPSIGDMTLSLKKLNLKSLQLDLEISNKRFDEQERAIKKLSDAVKVQEREINAMTKALKKEENALKPLREELKLLEDQFNTISESIQKAQADLDKFTNPKLKGMGEFDDKIHDIDMQLNKLQRARIDEASGLTVWDKLGLTDTEGYKRASQGLENIDKQIGLLEDSKSKLELDRSIAYDDQLYQLGKIADKEEEITFEAAVAGATAANEQITSLTDQLSKVGSEIDTLTNEISLREKAIEKQQDIIDARREELDVQNEIITSKQDELDAAKDVLQNAKDNLEYEKNRLSTLIQIKELQMDIDTDVQRRTGEIEGAERALEISEQSHALELTQQSIDENSNQLTKVTEASKTLTSSILALITGIDFKNLSESQAKALEETFGKGFVAELIKTAIDAGSGGKVPTPPTPGPGVKEATKNTIFDTMAKHPYATTGLGVMGGYGLYKAAPAAIRGIGTGLKKGVVNPLAKFGQGALEFSMASTKESIKRLPEEVNKVVATMRSQTGIIGKKGIANAPKLEKTLAGMFQTMNSGGVPKEKLDKLWKGIETYTNLIKKAPNEGIAKIAGNKRSALLNEVESLFRETMDNVGKTTRFQRAGRRVADLLPEKGRQFIEGAAQTHVMNMNARTLQGVAEKTGTTAAKKAAQEAAELVKRQPLGRRIAVGAVSNIPFISKPVKQLVDALTSSGGSAISRIRGGMYSGARLLGIGKNVATGEGASAAIRQFEGVVAGKTISGKGLGRSLNPLKWGEKGAVGLESMPRFLEDIPGIVSKIPKGIKGGARAIGKSIMAVLDPITAVAKVGASFASKVGLKGVGKALTKAIPVVGWASLVGDAVRGIDSKWANDHIWKKVFGGKTIGEAIWENKIADTFKSILGEEAFNGIRGAMGHAMEALKDISTLFEEAFSTAIGFIKGIFTGDWSGFTEGLDGMWKALKGVFSNFGAYLWELIKAGWEFDKKILGAIADAFTGAWDWIKNTGDGVASWPGKVWEFLARIGTTIGEKAQEIVRWFSDVFIAAWSWISKEIPTWPGKIWGFLSGIGTWIENRINDAAGWFTQIFKKAWDWISNTDGEGPAAWPSMIWGFIEGIGTFVTNNVNKIGDVLYAAGKTIVDKIGEGMRAAWETIEDLPILGVLAKLGEKGIDLLVKGLEKTGVLGGDGPDIGDIVPGKISGYGNMAAKTENAWNMVSKAFPGLNFWGGYDRTYHDSGSDHWVGKAFDLNSSREKMDAAASWLVKNMKSLNLKYVIWEQQINSGNGWRDMKDRGSATANHLDHVHVSTYHGGGITPGLPSQEMLAKLTGQEAVVPLQNGSIPVTIKGGSTIVYETNTTVQPGAIQITVRDGAQGDQDIKDIQEVLLKLLKNQNTFRDSPFTYPQSY